MNTKPESIWSLYILDCDGRLYTGISTDVARRLQQHQQGKQGARFTRAARQISLCYQQVIGAHGLALRAEARLKKLPRREKLALIDAAPEPAQLLAWLQLASS